MQVGSVTTPFGRRPMSLALLATQSKARCLENGKSVDKWKLYRMLCTARKRLGLSDRALTVMNALLSFYPKTELSREHGLIVFPSNAQLSLRANGMPEATLRRHLAALGQAGLLVRKDSANGKRYARRNRSGALDDAFGFSLAPLLARADEIEEICAELDAERLLLQRLRERLSICRRDVAKLIEMCSTQTAPSHRDEPSATLRNLVSTLPRSPSADQIAHVLHQMEALRDDLAKHLEDIANHQNMSGNALQNERHIQSSEPESLIEVKPSNRTELNPRQDIVATERRELIKHYPLAMVVKACPEISNYGPGGSITNWREMMTAAIVVHSTLRVSPSAFQEACRIMGPENAATAMACILERAELISSAGGYLRDLTRRAQQGNFTLGPMLMALLRAPDPERRAAS